MRRHVLVIPALAIAMLAGCTKSDEVKARQKAREAGQEIKEGLAEAKREAKEAGAKLREELKEAGDDIREGADKAKREIKKGFPDESEADRKKPSAK